MAHPTAPADVKETFAKDHFIDALSMSDKRLTIMQARPKNLNEAVRHAIELEAFLKAEQRQGAVNPSIRALGQENFLDVGVATEVNDVHASILYL